jgi:large subunit ribosomal protein L9e
MRTINSNQVVKIPKGVSVKVNARVVTIKGPRGKLRRDFRHLAMDLYMTNRKKLVVEKWFGTKKEIAAVRTVCSHIDNMIKGEYLLSGPANPRNPS